MAQCILYDFLGWTGSRNLASVPTSLGVGDFGRKTDRQILQQPLCDEPAGHEEFAGRQCLEHLGSYFGRLVMDMLTFTSALDLVHRGGPEMVCICANVMDLDLEALLDAHAH